ncbi:hypothetical protein M9H77_07042 [Catharanthus roseus]|uniref:Uncharacterized protein n=3 Tax=Catharanthus roseus TaxID=4058 RepID=A0ACC0BTU1_CATRO|nr:hypothetical protein M9H77_07040 [Catharanthus roseus]KAI5676091.1 hypothetical protein M9H77_07041 [Catharanthus roseus]KAI5676092.1 hypothetical protein M9H77_07042 [Catharanthus roseus]
MIFKSIKFRPRSEERTNKTSLTSRREKVPLKRLENVKLLATLDILNPRPQEGLNKIFSSKFKKPKSTSQHIAKNRRQYLQLRQKGFQPSTKSQDTLLEAKDLGDQDKMKEKIKPLKTLKTCVLVRDMLRYFVILPNSHFFIVDQM